MAVIIIVCGAKEEDASANILHDARDLHDLPTFQGCFIPSSSIMMMMSTLR